MSREAFIQAYEEAFVKNWVEACAEEGFIFKSPAFTNIRRHARCTAMTLWDLRYDLTSSIIPHSS